MSDTAQALAVLTQQVAVLTQQVAEQRALLLAPPSMPRAKRQDLANLAIALPALHAVFMGREFLAGEAIDAANAAMAGPLYAAVSAIVDAEREGVSPGRRLGRFLARHEGVASGGLFVERIGDTRDGVLWAVRVSA